MSYAYSRDQVEQKLLQQGYSPEQASQMANMMGDVRTQDNNLVPNTAEGAGYLAAAPLANKIPGTGKLAKFGRFALPGVAGNLAGLGASAVTGNNFYEEASAPQLVADIGGQILGAGAGTKIGEGLTKALATKVAPRVLGAINPLAGLAGSVLAGYLAPKLFASDKEKVIDPDAGVSGGTLAALAAAGAIASPIGRPLRKLVTNTDSYKKVADWAKPGTDIASKYKQAFFTDPFNSSAVGKAYNDAALHNRAGILRNIDPDHIPDPDSFRGTLHNARMTLANTKAVAPALEQLGFELGNLHKKRKNQ
jgi:hypothetical protein